MNAVFQLVYSFLMWISNISGFTYNEVNIIGYYIILPFAYVFLADRILKSHLLKITYIGAITVGLLVIPSFNQFSDWLFDASVRFLLSLQVFGWNYIISSVLVCVLFPGIVLMVMFLFAYPGIYRKLRGLL